MVKSLSSLRKVERFWPWLFQIASGKIGDVFRKLKRTSEVKFSTLEDYMLKGVGTLATVLGVARSRWVATLTALLCTAIVCWHFWPENFLRRADVSSVHFTMQSRNNDPTALPSTSKGAYETWYSFIGGVDGSVMMRQQRWDSQMQHKMCS